MQEKKQEKPATEPKAPDPRLPVRVVGQKGASILVEWLDEGAMFRRAYVPADKVRDGSVASKELAKGIPYGLPWEKWIEITATPELVANALRRQGVWNWEDITNAALQAANMAFDKGAFLRRVEKETKR